MNPLLDADVYGTVKGDEYKVEDERALCNDICLPHDSPHFADAYVIGNEYGPLCLVWAGIDNIQEALDNACDGGMLDGIAVDEADIERDDSTGEEIGIMRLGNASEPFCSDYAWVDKVVLTHVQELRFAEARGAGYETLDRL